VIALVGLAVAALLILAAAACLVVVTDVFLDWLSDLDAKRRARKVKR